MKITKTILFSIILLGIDLISKYLFFDKVIFSDWVFINPTFNTGISRGIQANMIIIILISIIALIIFIYLFIKKHIGSVLFSILISGALGNLIDRIFLGGVRDFISISSFPIFNIADILLNIGIILLLIKEFTSKTDK